VAQYEAGVIGKSIGASTAGALMAIRTGANEIRVTQINAYLTAGLTAAERVALYRTTAVGTASTSLLGRASDPNDAASLTNVDTNWSVNPTIATNPMRYRDFNTTGDVIAWHWDEQRGFVIPPSSSVVVYRVFNTVAGTGPVLAFTVVWEE
jgi:hypothetical protein